MKGIMEKNVEQYHSFEQGRRAFGDYVQDCSKGVKQFNRQEVVTLIDSFGEGIATHPYDGTSTLVK